MAKDLGFEPTTLDKGYYFISYNSEDFQRVGEICKLLDEAGLPMWYDKGIPYDEEWETVIAKKVDCCDEAIFFITKGIFDKGHNRAKKDIFTYKEYALACTYEKRKLMILLDEIAPKNDVPYNLMPWWQDISPSVKQGLIEYGNPPEVTKSNILKLLGKEAVTVDKGLEEPTISILESLNEGHSESAEKPIMDIRANAVDSLNENLICRPQYSDLTVGDMVFLGGEIWRCLVDNKKVKLFICDTAPRNGSYAEGVSWLKKGIWDDLRISEEDIQRTLGINPIINREKFVKFLPAQFFDDFEKKS